MKDGGFQRFGPLPDHFSLPPGLERITALMHALGDPQEALRVVHIAGTNGKGSTAAMIAEALQAAGKRTGLFVSPFVLDFRERIQIDRRMIGEAELEEYGERVRQTGVTVTAFEFITAVAYLYFKEKNCDFVVAETGLGGRFDATNVIRRPEMAVLTRIGMDHAAILGDTVEKIAAEKCGIIKEHCPVVAACGQPDEAMAVIRRAAPDAIVPDPALLTVRSCSLTDSEITYRGTDYRLSLGGDYQVENALTVIEAVRSGGWGVSEEALRQGLANTFFPARAEVISSLPLCLLDGAHNPDGAAALARLMAPYHGRITAIVGMMRDKDTRAVLAATLPHCRAAVAVTVEGTPRALEAEALREQAARFCPCVCASDYREAIRSATERAGSDPVFVFGSLYLASGMRDLLFDFFKKP